MYDRVVSAEYIEITNSTDKSKVNIRAAAVSNLYKVVTFLFTKNAPFTKVCLIFIVYFLHNCDITIVK